MVASMMACRPPPGITGGVCLKSPQQTKTRPPQGVVVCNKSHRHDSQHQKIFGGTLGICPKCARQLPPVTLHCGASSLSGESKGR